MEKAKQVFVAVVLVFLVTTLTKSIFDFLKNRQFFQAYKQEYEEVVQEHKTLQTALVKAQDMSEFEKNIRNTLNYHKKDERIVLVPEPTPTLIEITPTIPPVFLQWAEVFFSH